MEKTAQREKEVMCIFPFGKEKKLRNGFFTWFEISQLLFSVGGNST
jgi:hypothetical protein